MTSTQSLTLNAKPYIISECQSFYFDGLMSSCPNWFLDFLEDSDRYYKGQDVHGLYNLHIFGLANGCPTIIPNSLVFVTQTSTGPVVQSLHGAKPNGEGQ